MPSETPVGDICRSFSTPKEGGFEELAELVVTAHGRELIKQFLLKYSDPLSKEAPALYGLLNQHAADMGFDVLWHTSTNRLWNAVTGSEDHAWHDATLVGLRLLKCSQTPTEWHAPLPAGKILFDQWLLPEGEWITVRTDGLHADLTIKSLAGHNTVSFARRDGCWFSEREPAARTINANMQIVPMSALSASAAEGLSESVYPDAQPEMTQSCIAALALLEQAGPCHLAWVTKVIREILPLHSEPNRTKSGSRSGHPGLVHMSLPESPIVVADNLIHEASHQYYHLACRIEPVDTGQDKRLYYSPVVNKERPISRILLAFHAFGNVALLYEECLSKSIDDGGYCAERRAGLAEILRQLYDPLADNRALTPTGSAIVRPLAHRLSILGIL